MSITCNTLLHQNFFESIKLMAGSNGLDRVVSWACICQTEKVSYYAHRGALLFITDIILSAPVLNDILEEGIKKNLAGLVIITDDKYIKEIPASLMRRATAARFPIFSVPWSKKIIDITQCITRLIMTDQLNANNIVDFLNYLLFADDTTKDMLLNRAFIDQISVPRYSFVCIFTSAPTKNIIFNKSMLRQKLDFYCNIHHINSMSIIYGNNVILLAGANNLQDIAEGYTMLDEYQKMLNIEAQNTLQTAFGNICDDISKIKNSYQEANFALIMLSHFVNRHCFHYSELDFYHLLQQIENENELQIYCCNKLQILFEQNSRYKNQLLKTLKIFLESQNNIERAALVLHVHRNTVAYRLKKISSMLHIDYTDSKCCFELHLAIFIKEYLENKIV
ncbi:PucR family transcriptional regulator [uncultured Phascolarctobacterium sp.]|uniref:PucR family transcriptional regulator n=1 Tax=uncultured Phascolarctobacterium sp. TaxID=512296 RepID=UPI002635FCC4|nr:PucR family transcriptional regulator [uncultured Phascolarctobacterium sp.]